MISGDMREEIKIQALEVGISNFFTKPFRLKDIIEALEKIFNKKNIPS